MRVERSWRSMPKEMSWAQRCWHSADEDDMVGRMLLLVLLGAWLVLMSVESF